MKKNLKSGTGDCSLNAHLQCEIKLALQYKYFEKNNYIFSKI